MNRILIDTLTCQVEKVNEDEMYSLVCYLLLVKKQR
jgi:hypothetical protein